MKSLFIAVAAAYFVHLLLRWKKRNRVTGAAFNVLLAKHTFSTLTTDRKRIVEQRAVEILACVGIDREFYGEVDRYGWFALAMNELGINPAIKHYPGWNKVRNPILAVVPGDPALVAAARAIKERWGVDVSVSSELKPRYSEAGKI